MAAQHITLQIVPAQGNSIGAALLLVTPNGVSIPAVLYTDASLTSQINNPITLDDSALINFWVADDSLIYDGFLSGGYVIGNPQLTNLHALSSPQTISVYQPKYFQLDLVPQIGGIIGNVIVSVKYHGTSTNALLFSSDGTVTPTANPYELTSNSISFYVPDKTIEYDIEITGGNLVNTVHISNILSLPGPIWADKSTFWQNEDHIWAYIYPYSVSVKKVANVGQMYTANDLVRAAMRLIQVSAVDTDLTAAELKDGIESLNRMIDSWSLEELMLYQVIREQFPLVSGQNPYSIGLGGDWDTTRPTKIVGAYLTLNNGAIPVDYPMIVLNYDDYNSIRLKTLSTNFPGYLYYQPSFPIAEAYIYPIFSPNDPSTQGPAYVTITSWKPFDMVVDPTAYIALPPGYWEAIVFNLATRIAEEYQFDMRPSTLQLAQAALKKIKRMNQRTPTLQTDVALMNTSQLRYNIYSDSMGR